MGDARRVHSRLFDEVSGVEYMCTSAPGVRRVMWLTTNGETSSPNSKLFAEGGLKSLDVRSSPSYTFRLNQPRVADVHSPASVIFLVDRLSTATCTHPSLQRYA